MVGGVRGEGVSGEVSDLDVALVGVLEASRRFDRSTGLAGKYVPSGVLSFILTVLGFG